VPAGSHSRQTRTGSPPKRTAGPFYQGRPSPTETARSVTGRERETRLSSGPASAAQGRNGVWYRVLPQHVVGKAYCHPQARHLDHETQRPRNMRKRLERGQPPFVPFAPFRGFRGPNALKQQCPRKILNHTRRNPLTNNRLGQRSTLAQSCFAMRSRPARDRAGAGDRHILGTVMGVKLRLPGHSHSSHRQSTDNRFLTCLFLQSVLY
jgi:hypothetical protein